MALITDEIEEDIEFDEDDLELIDLTDPRNINFAKIVKERRVNSVTKESFLRDVRMWQDHVITSLPTLNEESIKNEISTWELEIPIEEYDLKVLQAVYSKLTSYQFRVAELMYIANAHNKTFTKAYKSLKIMAMALYSGTAKDKEAFAENETHIFLLCTVKSESLYDYLKQVYDTINFAGNNMSRILREREAQSKMNIGYQREGSAHRFAQIEEEYEEDKELEENPQVSTTHTRKRSY